MGATASSQHTHTHTHTLARALAHTLAHTQARYQLFNPDAARPAKRVYVGNLPATVGEGELRQAVNELMVACGGTAAPGFPITSCKLYQVCVCVRARACVRACV